MRVLWFANTPCEASEYLTGQKVKSGGWLYALCEQLKAQSGVELHVAFFWGKALKAFAYKDVMYHPVERVGAETVWGRYVNRVKGQYSDVDDKRELERCKQIVREISPDIIHVHGSEETFGLIAQDESIHVPVVLSIQGLLNAYRVKYYSGISKNDLKHGEALLKRLLMDGVNGRYRNFCRRAKREANFFKSLRYVIGRTLWDRRCALALNPNAVYFTVNEILRPEFMQALWQKHAENQHFVLVSTISSGVYKGLEVVYHTAKLLTDLHFSFVWKIIGLSADDETVGIVEKSSTLHASAIHIELLGSCQADEMIPIMLQSDMYVQVSHIENSPNSLCEAMAMGMPIIASYAGGTSSMLENGKEGVLIQDGNGYELAGAIMEAKQDYTNAIKMGEAARRRALNRHNPDNVVKELMKVYMNILQFENNET